MHPCHPYIGASTDAPIGCVYMLTDSNSVSSIYEQLKEDVLSFKQKGRVVLLGDFNARVGKSVDVIGMSCLGKFFVMGMGID